MGTSAPAAIQTGCWLPDALLVEWERALLAAVLVPEARDEGLYWNLDTVPAATLTALCAPREGG